MQFLKPPNLGITSTKMNLLSMLYIQNYICFYIITHLALKTLFFKLNFKDKISFNFNMYIQISIKK